MHARPPPIDFEQIDLRNFLLIFAYKKSESGGPDQRDEWGAEKYGDVAISYSNCNFNLVQIVPHFLQSKTVFPN